MARTTAALVGGIIELDASISLDPFIEAANMLVTQCCNGLAVEYSTTELAIIEKYLAAHFYTDRDPRAESEKAGPVAEKFQSKVDLGLSTSHYGQRAMLLDYHGGLASLNKQVRDGVKKTVGVVWLGTEDPTDIEE